MQLVIKTIRNVHADSLARNSLYLMMSTLIMSVLGFFFWIIIARLYDPSEIGIATSLISLISLISTFSQLGFNNTLVRDLPTTKDKNAVINTACVLVGITALICGIIYIVGVRFFSPKLVFIQSNLILSILFLIAVTITAINSVTDNIFVGLRNTKYILIYNTAFSIVKLILPLLLIPFAAFGIFLSVAAGITVALLLTIYFLMSVYGYRPRLSIDQAVLRSSARYSFGTYAAGLIGGIPSMVIPILILNILGPSHAAYYYMAFTIASLLFVIPQAVTRSMFAESSSDLKTVKNQVKKSAKLMYLLIVPASLMVFFFGGLVLRVFGKSYSSEGLVLLRFYAAATIFMIVNYIGGTLFYVNNEIKRIFIYNTAGAVIMLTASVAGMFITKNIAGLGAGFLFTQALMTIAYIPQILRIVKSQPHNRP